MRPCERQPPDADRAKTYSRCSWFWCVKPWSTLSLAVNSIPIYGTAQYNDYRLAGQL
jgi:hypothetical protein